MTIEQKTEFKKFTTYYSKLEKEAPYSYYLDEPGNLKSWKDYVITESMDRQPEVDIEELKIKVEDMDRSQAIKYLVEHLHMDMEEEGENLELSRQVLIEENESAKVLLLLKEVGRYIPAMQSVYMDMDINEFMKNETETEQSLYFSSNKDDTNFEYRVFKFIEDNGKEGTAKLLTHIKEVLVEESIVLKGVQFDTEELIIKNSKNTEEVSTSKIASAILKVDYNALKKIQKKDILSFFQTEEETAGKSIKH